MTKILGIGNALVDIMTQIESDELLSKFNLPKGSMQLVDKATSDYILKGIEHLKKQKSSGGSAANTIHGLANLGVETGFIGTVGEDELGDFFHDDLKENNIKPFLNKGNDASGKAIALVSPDSERTFATFLGAALELSEKNIKKDTFSGYDYLHVEGYLVQNQDFLLNVINTAKVKGLKVSLDLASYNVVEANLDFLKNLIKEHIDIVFANEEEAKAFTGFNPESALHEIANHCEIAVVKIGKNGSLIKDQKNLYKVGVIKANSIDTTGAGDVYASGFLYGISQNLPLSKCGELGALLSGKVIEVLGAKMSKNTWAEIKTIIKNSIQ